MVESTGGRRFFEDAAAAADAADLCLCCAYVLLPLSQRHQGLIDAEERRGIRREVESSPPPLGGCPVPPVSLLFSPFFPQSPPLATPRPSSLIPAIPAGAGAGSALTSSSLGASESDGASAASSLEPRASSLAHPDHSVGQSVSAQDCACPRPRPRPHKGRFVARRRRLPSVPNLPSPSPHITYGCLHHAVRRVLFSCSCLLIPAHHCSALLCSRSSLPRHSQNPMQDRQRGCSVVQRGDGQPGQGRLGCHCILQILHCTASASACGTGLFRLAVGLSVRGHSQAI